MAQAEMATTPERKSPTSTVRVVHGQGDRPREARGTEAFDLVRGPDASAPRT